MLLFVFDIDGTLTESVDTHVQCFVQALADLGITTFDSNWGEYTHHTDSWIFGEIVRRCLGREPTADERAQFESRFTRHFAACAAKSVVTEIPGARAFVERLSAKREASFAFATGSFRQAALQKLEQIGLNVSPELLVTASEYETREDIVSNAIAAARSHFRVTEFKQVVSIGDGYWDLMTARNLDLRFIGIGSGRSIEKMVAAGATTILPNFLSMNASSKEQWLA